MEFVPVNRHLLVEPIVNDSLIDTRQGNFEEKGKILAWDGDECELIWEKGETVYFDAWMVAKYPGPDGKPMYLVPETAIRGYEPLSE